MGCGLALSSASFYFIATGKGGAAGGGGGMDRKGVWGKLALLSVFIHYPCLKEKKNCKRSIC